MLIVDKYCNINFLFSIFPTCHLAILVLVLITNFNPSTVNSLHLKAIVRAHFAHNSFILFTNKDVLNSEKSLGLSVISSIIIPCSSCPASSSLV
jgi:hypothetical protein